jgi:integrase
LVQKRNRALILLLLSTGARSSEVLRLDRSEWKSERWWVLGEGDRERIVEVTDKVRAAVEDYLDPWTTPPLCSLACANRAASFNRFTIAGAQHVCRQFA